MEVWSFISSSFTQSRRSGGYAPEDVLFGYFSYDLVQALRNEAEVNGERATSCRMLLASNLVRVDPEPNIGWRVNWVWRQPPAELVQDVTFD